MLKIENNHIIYKNIIICIKLQCEFNTVKKQLNIYICVYALKKVIIYNFVFNMIKSNKY